MTLRSVALTLSLLGVAISGYALFQHYGPEGSGVCNFSETFSCDLVNRGPWSEIVGMPVAGVGLFGYIILFVIALLRFRLWERWFFAAAAGGVLFSLYLTYLEAFVIRAFCPVCLVSLADIAALAALGAMFLRRAQRPAFSERALP